ncbi:NAD(P)/FAD-dependent oxidoreductase [Nonomuraea sp. JJY05]|uniref:NAD(P)/FAD-dependent oxidoreductase n=1 Tax=Nonomuraea sp. JJY05 TaxID=3350255 RepID=UPI00373EE6E1
MNATTLWDTIVVGGGAAGLSAGVVLARARFATLVVDGGEPRNGPADHMHGYLTQDGMAPREFVATGLTDELPGIPGLSERWASEVHHCPHCHGYEVRGRTIVVIGSTMAAVSAHLAALMRRHSSSVTFCVNGTEVGAAERQRLTAYGVRLVDARVARVSTSGGGGVAIELGNGETVTCEVVFVAPRPVPHDAILTTLGAGKDPVSGLVAVDPQGATNVPGLWAAGNVVNPRAQVVAAAGAGAGAGATAAISMTAWLLERELSAAVSSDGLDVGGAI